MAGSDQSVNLGGMLNQMNTTIGQMGAENGKMLGGVIANANMPEVDPNDPQSMFQYADWARRNGKPQEAMMIQQQAAAAQKEMQKRAVAEAQNRMVGQYAQAARAGEGEQAAYDNLIEFAKNAGVDVTQQVNSIDAGVRAAQDQEWQAAQQAKQTERENAQQMAMGAMVGKSEAEIQAAVEKAPEQFRDIYQTVATRELQFQEQVSKAESRKEDLKTPVDTKGIDSAIGQLSNEDLGKRFRAEMAQLEDTRGNYWDSKKGQWRSTEAKRAWEREVSKLHRSAWDAVTREVVNKENRELAAEEDFQRAIGKARSAKVTETEIENYMGANNPFGPDWLRGMTDGAAPTPTREQAIAGVIAEREQGVREAYGRAQAPVDGGNEQPTGIPAGWTPEEWNALTPEEQATLR